jgi:alpha-1,3/alpha-1,6-mannosyltransferase
MGGAERLIVDMALASKQNGHDVTILTNQYDKKHCFEDTKDLNIIVKANSIPRHILGGRFHAFLAYLKIFLATIWLLYFSKQEKNFDLAIVDQISLPCLLFKWKKVKCIFYCHFPDQLLCVYGAKEYLKHLYRIPINWLESKTTGMADTILVNSNFTKKIFYDTFTSLSESKVQVLYPSLNTDVFDEQMTEDATSKVSVKENDEYNNLEELKKSQNKKFIFLSINRYERKKDLKLAIKAMGLLKSKLSENEWNSCHMILAGGYDKRLGENINHFAEIQELVKSLKLESNVSLMRSINDKQKINLLNKISNCLIYTPTNEHFGIVPVEAMYCYKPVIAVSSGGPLETVIDGKTGFLVKSDPEEFSRKMLVLLQNTSKENQKLGSQAHEHVVQNFSFQTFKKKLNSILTETLNSAKNNNTLVANKED